MQLSPVETSMLVDMAQDTHQLYEVYAFVRHEHPELSEIEVVNAGRELLQSWVKRGWLRAFQSRTSSALMSGDELLAAVDSLGPHATDPTRGVIVLELAERAAVDVDWLSKTKSAEHID
jgi:hypothetical protein